jgi:hypothetical protein
MTASIHRHAYAIGMLARPFYSRGMGCGLALKYQKPL